MTSLNQFLREVRTFREQNATQAVLRATKAQVLRIFRKLVDRTPVRTGQTKANWRVLFQGEVGSARPLDIRDKVGGRTIARARAKLTRAKAGDTIWIHNPLRHIFRLEQGASKQAPLGFIAITLAEEEVLGALGL